MKLWIRNQDKENIIKVDALEISEEECDEEIIYEVVTFYSDKLIVLGCYKTKERALEVLDEIQAIIKLINAWELDKNSFNICIAKFGFTEDDLIPIMNKMQCYEMPEE